jgi:flagellar hook-associated protein 2
MAVTGATSTASQAVQNTAYQLMATDRIPLQRLQAQKAELDSRTKGYQGLGSKLSSLLTLARSFATTGSANPLQAVTVTNGDSAAFTVKSDGTAEAGSHTVEVLQTASRHAIASVPIEVDSAVTGGTAGRSAAEAGGTRFRISTATTSMEYSVDLTPGATQGEAMDAIARAINAAEGPVTAGVIALGDGRSRLVLQSASTGEAARITAVEDLEGAWMANLQLAGQEGSDPLSSTVQTATDARLRIDGIEVTAPENTVRTALPGVTIELHAVSSPVAVQVEPDAAAVAKSVQDFVTQYNAAMDEVRRLTQPADNSGQNRGLFTSDAAVSRLRTALRDAVALPMPAGNSIRTLSELGLTTDRQGHLQVDDTKLRTAVETDPRGVNALWTGAGGVASRFVKLLEGYGPNGTTYTRQLDAWRSQGKTLDTRIARENTTLARRETTLIDQLAKMQSTVASLAAQQNYLGSLLASSDKLFA